MRSAGKNPERPGGHPDRSRPNGRSGGHPASGSAKRRATRLDAEQKRRINAPAPARLALLNKPFGVLCQFTDPDGRPTLADLFGQPGFYAAGRLDRDSEGLLLLTDNGGLQHRISHPRHKLPKTYLAQVEGAPSTAALRQLASGVMLKDGPTAPAQVYATAPPESLWERQPPVRFRARIPTCWLSITLVEGRNRQVRRMTAAVGHPTLRLVRTRVGPFEVWKVPPGAWCYADPARLADSSRW